MIDVKKFLIALTLLLSLPTCAGAEPARNLSTSVDTFCWKYFATLDKDENIFYSPYGIHAALSILANGASGDTRKEILHALDADNVDALNDGHKRFSAAVEKNYRGESLFAEANLLLVDKKIVGRGLDENFQRVVTDVYKSDVRQADFSGNLDGERKKISQWVSDKTNGFIPNYNALANAATLTDLLNVVYFKGKWAMPFSARRTVKATFTNRDGSKSRVDMMSKTFKDEIVYHADDKFKGIKLPYSAGAVMYLILPVDDNALNVAELWNDESLARRADFLDRLKNSYAFDGDVVVRLPKVTLDVENNLVESLKAVGIKRAFTNGAEFFNIVKGTPLKIDNAKHRAKVKVDETGTEAAAVTEITMLQTTAVPNPPRRVYFLAERPFLFVIRDVESDVTLFAGVVNKF